MHFHQQVNYVEYSKTGQIIKGAEREIIRSKYEEDALLNNHTSIWGSFWDNSRWGYKCCHSFVKNSFCTGAPGKFVRVSTSNIIVPRPGISSDRQPKRKRDKDSKEKRIAKAMKQFDEDQKQETDERKRGYNSMYETRAPTEEEMEAYYRKRSRPNDPMAAFRK